MNRAALAMTLALWLPFAHGSEGKIREVTLAGKTYSVPMDGDEPKLVETPEIRMERFEITTGLPPSPDSRDFFWGINFKVKLKGKWNFEIFSPIAPRYVTKLQTDEPRYYSFMSFPYSRCPELWEPVLNGTDTTFIPFTIRMTPAGGGETLEFIQWAAGGADIKGRVQKAVLNMFGSRRHPLPKATIPPP